MVTIFLDFDGCVLEHSTEDYFITHDKEWLDWKEFTNKLLPGVREKVLDWYCQGHIIIITTGRPEIQREILTNFLAKAGIYCHQIVMSCGSGPRYLINDIDPLHPSQPKAISINIDRNEGIGNLDLTSHDKPSKKL